MLEKIVEWIAKPLIERIATLEAKIAEIEAEWPQIKEQDNGAN